MFLDSILFQILISFHSTVSNILEKDLLSLAYFHNSFNSIFTEIESHNVLAED